MAQRAVRVLLFAGLKEKYGFAEREVVLEGKTTASQLWRELIGEPLPQNVLVAINQTYAAPDDEVEGGDEVAFFPPVTGGEQPERLGDPLQTQGESSPRGASSWRWTRCRDLVQTGVHNDRLQR